jgi:hypothetical protein
MKKEGGCQGDPILSHCIRFLGGSIYLFFPQPDYVGPSNFLAFRDYLPKQIR